MCLFVYEELNNWGIQLASKQPSSTLQQDNNCVTMTLKFWASHSLGHTRDCRWRTCRTFKWLDRRISRHWNLFSLPSYLDHKLQQFNGFINWSDSDHISTHIKSGFATAYFDNLTRRRLANRIGAKTLYLRSWSKRFQCATFIYRWIVYLPRPPSYDYLCCRSSGVWVIK